MIRATLIVVALSLAGCVQFLERQPKPEPCQIWVRIDNGPWRCYERGKVLRDLCKATACSP